jgi:hypothetical protein
VLQVIGGRQIAAARELLAITKKAQVPQYGPCRGLFRRRDEEQWDEGVLIGLDQGRQARTKGGESESDGPQAQQAAVEAVVFFNT